MATDMDADEGLELAEIKLTQPSREKDFTNIPLDSEASHQKKKIPRKILHFSDGILEEYSSDEEDLPQQEVKHIDPKGLPWLSWIWYNIAAFASGTIGVADLCGEKLAWFFGITSPKYQYAIDEYYRVKAEEEAARSNTDTTLSSVETGAATNSKTTEYHTLEKF